MTAPDDNGRGITKLFNHLAGLSRGIIREGVAVIVTPLQGDILPDHQPHFVSHIVKCPACHMRVNAYRVGVHCLHQPEIAAIFFACHGAKPRGADVITPFDKQAFVIKEPALVVRLLHYLA